jgi:hypothetical protein
MNRHDVHRLRKDAKWHARTQDPRTPFGDLLVHQKCQILRELEDYVPGRYLMSRMKDARVFGEGRIMDYYGRPVGVSVNEIDDEYVSVPDKIRWEVRKSTVSLDERIRYLLAIQPLMSGEFFYRHTWDLVPYVWKEKLLGHRTIDVRRSIEKLKNKMDIDALLHYAPPFFRAIERTATIRDELVSAYPRWRAVLNCKHLKEEIMMAAWHPRRVEHILTTYGWEAYENLLGE